MNYLKQKLLLTVAALLGGVISVSAQTDVTSTYLTNADFSQTTALTSTYLYGYDKDGSPANFQTVDGWTSVVTATNTSGSSVGGYAGGVFSYGSSTHLKGNDKGAPASGPNGDSGNCLGFFAVWSAGGYFYQEVTLQPGVYTINIPVYNQSGTNSTTTYFGWTPDEGTASIIATPTSTGTWTTLTTSFTLTEATKGQIRVGYKSNGSGSGSNPHLFIDKVQILCSAFATDTDYDNLGAAISAVENKTLGFDAGEYAPYNYVEVIEALAQAQAIDRTANNSQATVQALTATLNTTMTANTEEVNAIWDASFEHDYSGQSGNINPIGWQRVKDADADGYNVRLMNGSNAGLAATSSGKAIFTKQSAYYGYAEGYTMPLNANTYYTISFIYGGWGDCKKDGYVTMTDPASANLSILASNRLPLDAVDGDSNSASWKNYSGIFKTNDAGNYVLGLRKDNENQQSQYVYGDFVLKTTTVAEATAYYNTVKPSVEGDYDASANGGKEKTAFKNALDADVSGMTVAEIMEAAAALPGLRDAFVNAVSTFDALAAEIVKAGNLGVDAAIIAANTATSSTTAATALTNTQNLKVAEYNYVSTTYQYGVSLGEWTSTGTNTSAADFSNEHWSGETRTYKNQNDSNGQGWNANSWEIHFSQDVTLPAGNYVFKVAGRQAAGDAVNTSLVVKLGDDELGSVNDFPRSNSSRGINKSGATAFEGDNSEFAHDGAGYGWEWRYVKFTLNEDATVNIAIHSVATAKYQWVSFGDYTVQTDDAANVSLIAYNIALASAITARDAAANKYVGGTDRSNLVAAIAADEGLDKTDADAIDAATAELNTAKETFTAGVASWNAYVFAKNTDYADDQPYASAEKYAAIATAKSGTVNTASEAATKAAAITSAYRLYVESNALAEGVSGAENKTTLISDPNMEVTYDGTAHTFGAWQVFGQTDGTIQLLSAESFTDGSGKNDYKYADIYKSDNNAGIKQTINLEPGKYLLTATARAANTSGATFGLFAGTSRTEISRIGNSGGVFDRGWNDASVEFYVTETSDVEIGVQSGNGKDLWWSATRFRLVKLPTCILSGSEESAPEDQSSVNVILNRTLSSSYWNTFSVPFDAAIPEGWTVKEFASATDNTLNFTTATSFEAGVPYLVKPASNVVNPTFDNVTVESTEGETMGTGNYKFAAQIYNKSLEYDGSIAYLSTEKDGDDQKIKKLTSGGIKGLRAYFIVPASGVGARIHFMEENETTGIESIDNGQLIMDNGAVYDLQGRKVQNPKRGMYIINGKKVIVK